MSCIAVQLAMLETAQARESEADNMLYHTTISTSEMNSSTLVGDSIWRCLIKPVVRYGIA